MQQSKETNSIKTQEITAMTAVQIGRMLQDRVLSEQEVLSAFYRKTEQEEKRLNAFLTLSKEEAFQKAEEISRRRAKGEPLSFFSGVPIAVKDNIATKRVRTTCASKMLKDYFPPADAFAMKKLNDAGMILFGKTNMDEFAMGSTSETSFFGAVSNPWNENHVPGGSSGGSAAAVAAGECCISLGTDTGGSVRQPAAYCGVTGFLPTYGSVSRSGLIAYASSFDQIGPIARTAEDCAALFDILCGKDEKDASSLHHPESSFYSRLLQSRKKNIFKNKTIMLLQEGFSEGVTEDVKNRISGVAARFSELGANVINGTTNVLPLVIASYYMISSAEVSSNLSRFDGVRFGYRSQNAKTVDEMIAFSRGEGFGEEVKKRLMLGTFILSKGYYDSFYRKAQEMRAQIIGGMNELFRSCDAILLPTTPDTAPRKGSSLKDSLTMYLSDIFTALANICGLPAISFPCGNDSAGLPIGAQLIGKKWTDAELLQFTDAYEQTKAERLTEGVR